VISSDSPTQPRYAIRGIQTGDFGVGTDSAVGVYVDGVYTLAPAPRCLRSTTSSASKCSRAAGTPLGRNSAAGAISIVTRKPADEFDAFLRLRVGEYDKTPWTAWSTCRWREPRLRVNGVWNQSDAG